MVLSDSWISHLYMLLTDSWLEPPAASPSCTPSRLDFSPGHLPGLPIKCIQAAPTIIATKTTFNEPRVILFDGFSKSFFAHLGNMGNHKKKRSWAFLLKLQFAQFWCQHLFAFRLGQLKMTKSHWAWNNQPKMGSKIATWHFSSHRIKPSEEKLEPLPGPSDSSPSDK